MKLGSLRSICSTAVPAAGKVAVFWSLAMLATSCGSSSTPSGTGAGADAGSGTEAGTGTGGTGANDAATPGDKNNCSYTFSAPHTVTGSCMVSVTSDLIAGHTHTLFSLLIGDQSKLTFIATATLSNQVDFHVGRYDTTNIVTSGSTFSGPDPLAGWGQSFHDDVFLTPDQGSFTMMVTSTGTAVDVPAGLGVSGIAYWTDFHGTLDVTVTPLNQFATGDITAHVTF